MKKRICIVALGVCLLTSSFYCSTTAYAASEELITTPLAEEDFSHQLSPRMTRIKSAPRAVSIKFRRSKYILKIGQKKRINITLRPSIAKEKPIYDSEKPEIADFIYGNTLQARQTGTTYITATLSNGKKARCKIIVRKKKKTKQPTTRETA
ncbi:MAG: hypothetical protein Q4D32_03995 [Eubacteriales bacterium]|nr:hypothetical protein [Eubacteriales bacterium]